MKDRTANTVSWVGTVEAPSLASQDVSCWTTTSTASPISTGGARSKILLMTEQLAAIQTLRR